MHTKAITPYRLLLALAFGLIPLIATVLFFSLPCLLYTSPSPRDS